MKQLVKSMQPYDELRVFIEHGSLGDGIHRQWMSEMQDVGVRRAYIQLKFSKGPTEVHFSIMNQSFLSNYGAPEQEIKDPGALKLIHSSSLEKQLGQMAIATFRDHLPDILTRNSLVEAEGEGFVEIFDDECMPHVWGVLELSDPKEPKLVELIDSMSYDKAIALLEAGASPNVQNGFGVTPLIVAARLPVSSEVVSDLLQHGANVNAADQGGVTALMNAAWQANDEVVSMLLTHGADVSFRDKLGNNALHHASIPGTEASKRVISLLLQSGCDCDIKNNQGITPLIQATSGRSPGVVRLLLEKGCDPAIRDRSGMTALDYAKQRVISRSKIDDELVRILESATKAH